MSNWLLKRCVSNLKRVTDELASLVAEPERPSRPARPEPEEPHDASAKANWAE